MKKVVLLVLLCSTNLFAQKYELGKVTLQELEEKVCPIDTSAVAAILFSKGESRFTYIENKGFVLTTTVQSKIKIYKKEGYDFANHSEKYFVGGNKGEQSGFHIFNEGEKYFLINGEIWE